MNPEISPATVSALGVSIFAISFAFQKRKNAPQATVRKTGTCAQGTAHSNAANAAVCSNRAVAAVARPQLSPSEQSQDNRVVGRTLPSGPQVVLSAQPHSRDVKDEKDITNGRTRQKPNKPSENQEAGAGDRASPQANRP